MRAGLHTERAHSVQPIVISASMRELYELARKAARTSLPVLILGETGSGKELVARAVHDESPRAGRPFKALNCAALPDSLVEAVLFGHERGAFTGAERRAPGVFEQAQSGTIFLDELGELSLPAQAALLRVLEQKSIVRVGGSAEFDLDVRVVAATHRELASMVAAGSFREDLFFRLEAFTLHVPPLRERREEIAPLAERFLASARARWGGNAGGFSEAARAALLAYHWPGNVRQLKHVVERSVAVATRDLIALDELAPAVLAALQSPPPALVSPRLCSEVTGSVLTDRVRAYETALIKDALERVHGSESLAARLLGVPRRTLSHKVRAYGLGPKPIDTNTLRDALARHGYSPERAAAALGVASSTVHYLMTRTPDLRRARDLPCHELREALSLHGSDLGAAAAFLRVSERALRMTLRQRNLL